VPKTVNGSLARVHPRHVLFDADGVLQHIPGGWHAAMEPYVGERAVEFFKETWREEMPALAGRGDFLPLLATSLAKFGVTEPAEQIIRKVWHHIELIELSIELVHTLRRNGYGVHLGTNQERHRASYMRSVLGFDDLFDVSCYSYDLGFAKPDVGFFVEAARRIGVAPSMIVFIDDLSNNVESARAAGLAAEHWHFEHGHDALHALLANHGVVVTTATSPGARPSPAVPSIDGGSIVEGRDRRATR
jgi:putative hydrolase of the HAD superfamily